MCTCDYDTIVISDELLIPVKVLTDITQCDFVVFDHITNRWNWCKTTKEKVS